MSYIAPVIAVLLHEVGGECGDVGWTDHAPDRPCRAELLATRVQLIGKDNSRQRVSTKQPRQG
jgi:hypothetical protein